MFDHIASFAGGFLASPTALLDVDRPSLGRKHAASASLALSGGAHFLLLGLLLYATGGNGTAERPLMEMRATIDHYQIPPPRLLPPVAEKGRSGPPAKDGAVTPAPPKEPPTTDPGDQRVDVPGLEPGKNAVPDHRPRGGDPGPPPPPRPAVNSGMPSTYDDPPVPIVLPEPQYPPIAQDAGIEGKVVVEALISHEGAVQDVRVVSGNTILLDAAVKAVWGWRFRPARWQGQPVTVWVSIPFHFKLH